jgi:diguanylate cyclase
MANLKLKTTIRPELTVEQRLEAIIEQKDKEITELKKLVFIDPLTGAHNLRGLEDISNKVFANIDRKPSQEHRHEYRPVVTILILDIDNFKELNDHPEYGGHDFGDHVLREAYKHLTKVTRSGDVVTRIGGDEFLVFFNGSTPDEVMHKLRESGNQDAKLSFRVKKSISFAELDLGVNFSGGIAQRMPGETLEQVKKRADKALYEAKRAGRNKIFKAEDIE